jgi:hypothetical protein
MTDHRPLLRRLISAGCALGLLAGLAATAQSATAQSASAQSVSAAPSPTVGLYGSADPTYDGVYRQSLAIMGLNAVDVAPAAAAVTWLLDQQCANGAFQAYRADLTKPCDPADAQNFTGPDTNSTAMAVMALMSMLSRAGTTSMTPAVRSRVVAGAVKAVSWLGRQQNTDGGWPWTTGGASDANSTGLALAALLSQAPNDPFPAYRKGTHYLGSLSMSCASGGGLAYQSGGPTNGLATAQALVGIAGSLPVPGPRRLAAAAPCANTAKAKSASYLARTLAASGTLPSALGDGPDYSGTADAVLGLVSARQGRVAVARATRALTAAAITFITHSGGPDAGALGLLLQVAEATGSTPTSFGGVNLVSTLAGSIRK